MVDVPPHGFSHSPVEKIECSWRSSVTPAIPGKVSPGTLFYDKTGQYTLFFGSPYPGWPVIAEKLAETLRPVTDAKGTVFQCRLSFIDRFMLSSGDEIWCLFSLSRFFPSLGKTGMSTEPLVYEGPSSSCRDTMVRIRFSCMERENRLVYIVFELLSVSNDSISADSALSWFEAVHDEIHLLFDEIVMEKMMERLV